MYKVYHRNVSDSLKFDMADPEKSLTRFMSSGATEDTTYADVLETCGLKLLNPGRIRQYVDLAKEMYSTKYLALKTLDIPDTIKISLAHASTCEFIRNKNEQDTELTNMETVGVLLATAAVAAAAIAVAPVAISFVLSQGLKTLAIEAAVGLGIAKVNHSSEIAKVVYMTKNVVAVIHRKNTADEKIATVQKATALKVINQQVLTQRELSAIYDTLCNEPNVQSYNESIKKYI